MQWSVQQINSMHDDYLDALNCNWSHFTQHLEARLPEIRLDPRSSIQGQRADWLNYNDLSQDNPDRVVRLTNSAPRPRIMGGTYGRMPLDVQYFNHVSDSEILERNQMMDTGLFIDTQYRNNDVDAQGSVLIFRRQYHDDVWGNPTPVMSTLPQELTAAYIARTGRADAHHRQWVRDRQDRLSLFNQRIRANLKYSHTDRWGHSASYIVLLRKYLHDVAKAIQQQEYSEVIDHLNVIRGLSQRLAERVYCHVDSDEVIQCSHCGDYGLRDTSGTDGSDNVICESCVDNEFTYSSCMGEYIPNGCAFHVYHSTSAWNNGSLDDCCTREFGNFNFYEWEGCYFTDEIDRDDLRAEHGEGYRDEDDEDDEYRDTSDGLRAWHCAPRNFTERNTSKKWPTLGVELEIYAPDRGYLVETLRDEYSTDTLILERDGSLDNECGVELISQPFGREEWDALVPNMLAILKKHRAVGYNEPAGAGYGIHVTVHRRYFSPLAEARMSMFLASTDNVNFVRAVAQRDQIYHPEGNTGIGQMTPDRTKVGTISYGNSDCYHRHGGITTRGTSRRQIKIQGKGKYCPINWKGDLAEFRLFQSTVNPSTFMKNLEFVWALQAWTKPEAATGNTFHYSDFVRWLNMPANRNDYPQLAAFLSKKVFYGTNYKPILSTWHNLMVKPVEEEAIEPMSA